MGFNSAFKGLTCYLSICLEEHHQELQSG